MFKIALTEMRNEKWMLAPVGFICVTSSIWFGVLGIPELIMVMLVMPPVFILMMHSQPRQNPIATIASLPIDRVHLAVSRYLSSIGIQLVIAAVVIIFAAFFDSYRASSPIVITTAIINGSLAGLGLGAIGLLVVDVLPKTASIVGLLMWCTLIVGMFFFPQFLVDWVANHSLQSSSSLPMVVVVLTIITLEVIVFSRRDSLL